MHQNIASSLKIFWKAYHNYKISLVVLIILGFISGLLEGIGINAIIPLFSLLQSRTQENSDIISQGIVKFLTYFNSPKSHIILIFVIIILFILKAVALFYANYINANLTSHYEKDIRSKLFKNSLKANWPYLSQQKIGYLEKVIMVDTNNASYLLNYLSSTAILLTSLIMYVIVALNISFVITILTLGVGGIIFFLCKPLFFKTRITSEKMANESKVIAHYINENILGMKTIKSLFVQDEVIHKGSEKFEQLKNIRLKMFLYGNFLQSFIQPISLIFICIIFLFSYSRPGFNIAAYLAILYLIQKIFTYVQTIQSKVQNMHELIPYLMSVLQYQDVTAKNEESFAAQKPFSFNKSLNFHNVDFSYPERKNVLSLLNFSIKRGEMVGLIGPSGAGKTTIVDLILRLLPPTSGYLYLDEINIDDINMRAWRKNIGYVSQEVFLLNDTIGNNISFFNENIDKNEIIEACKMANIYEFIQNLPDNISTYVGERGMMLSGGQRQRIALARILVRHPQILILDEATSSLDNESERAIRDSLEKLKGKITIIIIAHRLSTVLQSNKIIAVDSGKIIESGETKHLMQDTQSYFYKIFNLEK